MTQSLGNIYAVDPVAALRTMERPGCPACGSRGEILYAGLADGLFGVPGAWSMRTCSQENCGMCWLDPCPLPEDIHLAYASYYTHADVAAAGNTRRRKRGLRRLWKVLAGRYLKTMKAVAENHYRREVFTDLTVVTSRKLRWQKWLYHLFPIARADTDFSYMYTPIKAGGQLLEVGCGSGWMLELMQSRGWHAEGLDFDPKAVEYARNKGLQVRLGGLRDQDYPAQRFDLVTGSHLVEHLHDPEEFLRECRRVLKPDGSVVLVTPNVRSLGHRIFKRNWRGLEPPRHLQLFSAGSIEKMSKRAGFATCETRFSMRDANHLFQASHNLAARGAHRHGEVATPWLQFWTRALQWLEYVLMKIKPALGEELVVVLR